MAMLKFVRREVHSSGSLSRLSEEEIEAAKKGVTKALNAASDSTGSQKRGKYKLHTRATGKDRKICRREWPIPCSQALYRSLGRTHQRINGKEAKDGVSQDA